MANDFVRTSSMTLLSILCCLVVTSSNARLTGRYSSNARLLVPTDLIGNNGMPSNVFPLGECKGDCDNDNECGEGLLCLQRNAGDPIVGCTPGLGVNVDTDETDYCVKEEYVLLDAKTTSPTEDVDDSPTESPTAAATEGATDGEIIPEEPTPSTTTPTASPTFAATEVETHSDTILDAATRSPTSSPTETSTEANTQDATEAATQADTQAETEVETVAESTLNAATKNPTLSPTGADTEAETMLETLFDTTVETEQITTSNELDTSTAMPTMTETMAETTTMGAATEVPMATDATTNIMTEAPSDEVGDVVQVAPDLPVIPLDTVGNDGNFPSYPLTMCQGDCDEDVDCLGSLICFQRRMDEPVPGCEGQGEYSIDYCVDPIFVDSPAVVSSAFDADKGMR